MTTMINPFLGGCLIGLAVSLMLYFNGKITGNSGILGGIWTLTKDKAWWRLFYLAGLVGGVYVYKILIDMPDYVLDKPYPIIILAGLLVGYGTRLGGGCTSGHGICGIARFSKRSIVATVIFMAAGILTVLIVKIFGGAA
ncbi:MAG: YeeE/YedE family protein [Candidatus Omnitrophica bacterium]|nr:YeeE/YedE family protein [Candidatus Omnitrophota bacterium]